jgi:dTMP kinase
MFVTFEGPEGSGKSTQIRLLFRALREAGYDVLLAREPGGTSIGDQIRDVLHDARNTEMHPAAEILLYSASRAQLVAQVIRPALAEGRIVLCDRFADSTMAYQGYGRGLDLGMLRQITEFATGGLIPNLTLLLDVDVEAGLARRRRGGDEWNRMDQQAIEFYERTRQGYLALAAAEPHRYIYIDGGGPVEAVATAIWDAVLPVLSSRHG